MSYIQIKGVNDYLLFILNDEVCLDILFDSLQTLLSSPSFYSKNYYPKAYFDFGNREVTLDLFYKLMYILDNQQKVVFCGFEEKKKRKHTILHITKTIRNGQIHQEKEDCLFEGKINPGGVLLVYGNLYVLGSCLGRIELIGSQVSCSISKMVDGSISINGASLHHLYVDEMTTFYEENGEIKMKQEESYYG